MAEGTGPRHRSVQIEADGGSRGNPGAAAYGAVLKDARTGETIAEAAETIGVATNNVAEYRGLIGGLELYAEHTPGADLEVRMDSKLVVEQMSGRWKIKHPDMVPLATAAARLAPPATRYTWIPRARNAHADRLLNAVLDEAAGRTSPRAATPGAPPTSDPRSSPRQGWVTADGSPPTTLVLVRHGATPLTSEKRFSGTGSDPGLTDEGRAQVRSTADWLAPLAEAVEVVTSSPLRRARESADIVAERLRRGVEVDDGLTEADFGSWEGQTLSEIQERHPDELGSWLGGADVAPHGGESLLTVDRRVRRTRDRLIATHPGRTVLAVTHVTPIKVLVRLALGAPLDALFRMELAPASVTVVSWFSDGRASLRLFNARPPDGAALMEMTHG